VTRSGNTTKEKTKIITTTLGPHLEKNGRNQLRTNSVPTPYQVRSNTLRHSILSFKNPHSYLTRTSFDVTFKSTLSVLLYHFLIKDMTRLFKQEIIRGSFDIHCTIIRLRFSGSSRNVGERRIILIRGDY
jgi:hypothetical protein